MNGYAWILPIILFLTATPLHALTLEEIDREHKISKTFEQLLDLESRVHKTIRDSAPSDELTWRLARTYFALGKLAEGEPKKDYFLRCEELARQTLDLNKNSSSAYYFKGLCAGKLGELEGIWSSLHKVEPMKKDMQAAIEIDPAVEQGGPHRFLGRLYYELPFILGGSLDKSIDHLKKAVQYGPAYGENHLFLAEAYFSKGENRLARESLLELLNVTRARQADREVHEIRVRARALLNEIETP